jgi:hypothetical protein
VEVLEGNEGEIVGVKFVDLYLEGTTKTICYAMYSERQNIYLITMYDGKEGGMMRSSRGLNSDQQLFSIVSVCVLFVSKFCCFIFKSEYPDFGNSKGLH